MQTLLRRGVRRVLHFLLHRVVAKIAARPVRRRLAEFEAATHRPREVQEAVSRANTLSGEAKDAGVTEDVGQGERIAQLMSLYEARDVHLRLLGDVNALLESAAGQAGDVVLCTIRGADYLHIVKAIADDGRYQIGNNHGKINGWIGGHAIFGRLVRVEP